MTTLGGYEVKLHTLSHEWLPYRAADGWFTERRDLGGPAFLLYVSPEGDLLPEVVAATVSDPASWVLRHVSETQEGWDIWLLRASLRP